MTTSKLRQISQYGLMCEDGPIQVSAETVLMKMNCGNNSRLSHTQSTYEDNIYIYDTYASMYI